MKKTVRNLPVGRTVRRSAKKGNSTQPPKKTRSTPRYFEVKIRIPSEEYTRGLPHFDDIKYLPKFILDAYRERVNRAEANNKAARLKMLAGNIDVLLPVLVEMHNTGKLAFIMQRKAND